jgi:uncharacterized OB-fold protein
MSFQPLPAVEPDTEPFWTGGVDNELRITRCATCREWFHPPAPICPTCLSLDVGPEAASGRATVATYTVNHQPWAPNLEVPYVIAIVELADQAGVRLMTRLVDVAPDDVRIGMPVEVVFEHHDDVWIPLFRPAAVEGEGK